MLAKTYESKIGVPLGTIVKNFDSLLDSVEASKSNNHTDMNCIKEKVIASKLHSLLLLFQLKNIKDWDSIK